MLSQLFAPAFLNSVIRTTLLAIIICLTQHDRLAAAESVSGRYISTSGTAVVLSLNISQPAPASMIVEQYLEPGNNIAATSPHAVKVDLSQTKVKWLFKHVESGKMTLSINLRSPLQGKVTAIVRYRTPNSGAFTELRITQ